MKIALVFCVMMFTMSTMSSKYSFNVTDEEWNLFKMTYEKSYSDNNEELFRKRIYLENKLKIERHNKLYENGEVSYSMGMNQFGDITGQEFLRRMNTVKPNLSDIDTNYTLANFKKISIPKNLNWTSKGYVTSVRNQRNCDSSWAFSVTGAIEGQQFRKTGKLVSLSAQNLIDCTHMNCEEGGNRLDAFNYIQNIGGIDTLASYRYTAKSNNVCKFKREKIGAKIKNIKTVPKGDANLVAALVEYGPVSVSVKVTENFHLYKEGVFEDPKCRLIANHDVLAVGYGEFENGKKYWIIKNSWGTEWGMGGYMYLSRDINNLCSVSDNGLVPVVSNDDDDGDDDLLK